MASWSNFRARLSNRFARHLFAAPMRLKGGQPMVSFTFDDIPVSAATVGAPMLEEFGGLGTFYVAGGLVNRRTDQGDGVDPDGIVKLRRSGHEIACHTFSHQRAIDLDATTMAAEIEQNRHFLEGLDASIKLENFAYPYGLATVARKRQLTQQLPLGARHPAGRQQRHDRPAVPALDAIDRQGHRPRRHRSCLRRSGRDRWLADFLHPRCG